MYNITTKTKILYHILLTEAKEHLNIESSFTLDDNYITRLIKDSTSEAENYIDSDIAKTTTVLEYADFTGNVITLHDTPLISIDTISYLDAAGDTQEVTVNECTIKKRLTESLLVFPDGVSLDTSLLTITYTTGYATEATVPANINRGILLRISDYYDVNRGSMMSGSYKNSGAFERILDSSVKITY